MLSLLIIYLIIALAFCGLMVAWLIIMEYQDKAEAKKRQEALWKKPEGRAGDRLPIHPDY